MVPQQLGRQVPARVGAGAALDLPRRDVDRPGAAEVQRPAHRQRVRVQLGAQQLGPLGARGVEVVDEPARHGGEALQLAEGGGQVAGALVDARGQARRLEEAAVVALLAGEGAGLLERHPRLLVALGLDALCGDGQQRSGPQPVLRDGALQGEQPPGGESGEVRRPRRHEGLQQGGDQPDPQRRVLDVGERAERLERVMDGGHGPFPAQGAGEHGVRAGVQAPRVRGGRAGLRRLLLGQLEHVQGLAGGAARVAHGLERLRQAQAHLPLGILEQLLRTWGSAARAARRRATARRGSTVPASPPSGPGSALCSRARTTASIGAEARAASPRRRPREEGASAIGPRSSSTCTTAAACSVHPLRW